MTHPSCNDPENHLLHCAWCPAVIGPGEHVHRMTYRGGLAVEICDACESGVDYDVARTRVETTMLMCPCVRAPRTRSLRRTTKAA
jgi:hypothetical protein